MIIVYAASDENARRAKILYQTKYPDRIVLIMFFVIDNQTPKSHSRTCTPKVLFNQCFGPLSVSLIPTNPLQEQVALCKVN
ncbi:hypothetical protein WN55_01329 [Dufourea novaeangliae]|uniref:Uncharacterized protein n=1 Tax=Dufourea novaeangliae TaxID=178035 RepID=A0A154PD17_DUFNO|nr:hypothetical protein WN55_01329 [Dufourea novaeangliae]